MMLFVHAWLTCCSASWCSAACAGSLNHALTRLAQRVQSVIDDPASLAPSFEMVVSFTWIHMLVFLLFGMAAALLLERAERDSDVGFGILLLVFIFEAGFMGACMIFAEPVLQALTWPAIAVGNLLAACAMGAVFWRAHRSLTVQP